jgi:hypothetical protein
MCITLHSVQSLAFKLTVLRSIFLCLSIEFLLATVILYAKNCTSEQLGAACSEQHLLNREKVGVARAEQQKRSRI